MRQVVCRSGSSTRFALVATSLLLIAGCFKTPRTSFPEDDLDGGGGMGGGAGQSGGGGGVGGVAGRGGIAGGGQGGAGRALGQSCNGDQDCSSGHCSGRICCDQACSGTCQQCSASGVCEVPADDPACGTIACPGDSICRDYASSISSNRCKSIGQCKTAADCGYSNTPAKQVCGFVQGMTEIVQPVCDGAGGCVGPKVKCGGDGDCSPFDNMNCCGSGGNGLRCQATACPANQGPFWCDEKADCAPGYVCCSFLVPTPAVGSKCMLTENCVSSGPSNYNQVCNPAANPSECSTGSCQLGDGQVAPPGFYICK